MHSESKLGIVLSGGGSRGAYQAGVIKAFTEIDPDARFQIVTGLSAGAINAAFLAAHAHDVRQASSMMVELWSKVRAEDVFRTSLSSLLMNGLRLMWDLSFGGIHKSTSTHSLLDTAPLWGTLQKFIDFHLVRQNLRSGACEALAVNATDYGTAESVTFYSDFRDTAPWIRKRRRAEQVDFSAAHIMASSAIPLIFPSIEVGNIFYGDGCLRNNAPLSSAVHLGANRLLIIGVRKQKETFEIQRLKSRPSLGRVFGVILNSMLLEAIDSDVERLSRINTTLSLVPENRRGDLGLRPVRFEWVTPSEDIGQIAAQYIRRLPWTIRYLLRGLGTKEEYSEIASYLLFHPDFCSRLIHLGYQDTLKRRDQILRFLDSNLA